MKLLLIAPLLLGSNLEQTLPDTYEIYDRLMELGESTKSVDIRFTRRVYDHVRKVVRVADGRVYWESDEAWAFELTPRRNDAAKVMLAGQAYETQPDRPRRWVPCEGGIAFLDIVNKRRFPLSTSGTQSFPLIRIGAGLPRMKDLARFEFETSEENGKPIVLLKPKWKADSSNYSSLRLALNPKTLRPEVMTLLDASQTTTTVFELNREVIDTPAIDRKEFLDSEPVGYQQMSASEAWNTIFSQQSGAFPENAPQQTDEAEQRCVDTRFNRWVYDDVFKVVKLSTGRLYWEAPDRWMISIERVDVDAGATRKINGLHYDVWSDLAECWIRTKGQLIEVHGNRATYFTLDAPGHFGILHNVDKLLEIAVGGATFANIGFSAKLEPNKDYAQKIGYPLRAEAEALAKKLTILLDRKTKDTKAIRYVDPAGTKRTVVAFHDKQVGVVPPDRNEVLFPCPWLFDEEPAAPETQAQSGLDLSGIGVLWQLIRVGIPGF